MLLSALFLVVLLAALDLWAMHHFGIGIDSPGRLAVVLTALGAAWGLAARLLEKEEVEEVRAVRDRVARAVRRYLLTPALILVLYAAFTVAVLLFSSITVVPEPGAGTVAVTVTRLRDSGPVAAGRVGGERRQLRFGVATSPLAGGYVVRATGYLPTVVEATPLFGARVRLGHDVPRAPTVLVRPHELLLAVVRNGGHVAVFRAAGGDTTEIARSRPGEAGSFLLGRTAVPLAERQARWERQLLAAGVTNQEFLSQHLEDWMDTHPLAVDGDLAPGDTVLVRVVSPAGITTAAERVVLGVEDVEDIFLRPSSNP